MVSKTTKQKSPNNQNNYWANFNQQQYNGTASNQIIKSRSFDIILIFAKKLIIAQIELKAHIGAIYG